MKIKTIGEPVTVMSAPGSKHNYFGWPTVARLKDGRIAAAASGFRMEHVCPFGKAVIAVSEDECASFSAPEAVIDTPLDDRDAGLCPFGESGLILTSFNNTAAFQRGACPQVKECFDYLDTVTPEDEEKYLGSEFRISPDNGRTWGEIFRSPVISPHGPLELKDGRILWVGRLFSDADCGEGRGFVQVWELLKNGEMTFVGSIDNPDGDESNTYPCEPHMIELPDGKLICHIRVERGEPSRFTTWQSESYDSGKTWSRPRPLLPPRGGAPAHLLLHSSGVLISAYGYREEPYGIRVMFSTDCGESWQTDEVLYDRGPDGDLGYPATVELDDGSLFTVFYAHPDEDFPAIIMGQRWKITD